MTATAATEALEGRDHVSDNQTPQLPEPNPTAPDVDQTPFEETRRPSRRTLWLGVGAGAAVVAVGLGGVALGAAVGGDHDERSVAFQRNGSSVGAAVREGFGDRDRDGMSGSMGGGPIRGGAMSGPLGGPALHGELVVEDLSGDFVTVSLQQGEVTQVSGSSISLESADGFTATYAIDGDTSVLSPDADDPSDGLTGIKVGDDVHVVAQDDGGLTAQTVVEGFGGLGHLEQQGGESA